MRKTIDTQFAAGIALQNMLAGLRLSHPNLLITSCNIYNMRKAKAAAFLEGKTQVEVLMEELNLSSWV